MTERLLATTPQGPAGALVHADGYLFQYADQARPNAELSLGMPLRAAQYQSPELFPVFQMNLPEGYVLDQLRMRFAKTTRLDPMMLLAMTGGQAGIGRIRLDLPGADQATPRSISLTQLLAHEGSENLFQQLTDDYLTRSGVSGMQPKLLVPEALEAPFHQAAVTTQELIVKASGDGFPGLPINEFVCMSIAHEAGIPVAEFHLSDDHKRFVMRRFDRDDHGTPLGFEDVAVLMGRAADSKYDSSYEKVAITLAAYCAPETRATALAQLFDQIALSCMVGNGDAHLKNFGVLYSDPIANDVRLSPAYDIVCTTCYLPDDTLALSLNRNRNLFTARLDLLEFGRRHCEISDPKARLAKLLGAMEAILYTHVDLIERVPRLDAELHRRLPLFAHLVG